ncbi:hypothetical protein [Streptomyces shenzhenensis]|uniref:hypothetical protein n=1 Tax=Streptomyces shenzhenensis TaxID=943815 RepID=UPI003676628D
MTLASPGAPAPLPGPAPTPAPAPGTPAMPGCVTVAAALVLPVVCVAATFGAAVLGGVLPAVLGAVLTVAFVREILRDLAGHRRAGGAR